MAKAQKNIVIETCFSKSKDAIAKFLKKRKMTNIWKKKRKKEALCFKISVYITIGVIFLAETTPTCQVDILSHCDFL